MSVVKLFTVVNDNSTWGCNYSVPSDAYRMQHGGASGEASSVDAYKRGNVCCDGSDPFMNGMNSRTQTVLLGLQGSLLGFAQKLWIICSPKAPSI